MSVERANTKITIDGKQQISDYEKKLRSMNAEPRIYKKDLEDYVNNRVQDPIVRQNVLNEIAKYPCQALNRMFQRLDDLIIKIQKKVNEERLNVSATIKLPDVVKEELDISDLYSSITNVNQEELEEEEAVEEMATEEEILEETQELPIQSQIDSENPL
jgi:hypothetical protein